MKLKIMLTGSEGLIGKTLSNKLKEEGYYIYGIDSRSSSEQNQINLTNFPDLPELNDCDGIIHLAAVSRVVWGQKNPSYCKLMNVDVTKYLLEKAWQSQKKPWFIYASSREVYGQQDIFPVSENAELKTLNAYAETKLNAEKLVMEYQQKGLKCSILRFSSVYGRTDDHADRVVPAFCKAVVMNKPLYIEGEDNTFDFTHVEDVANGIIEVVNQLERNTILPPIHFTSGIPTTLMELAMLAKASSNSKSEIIIMPKRSYDVSKFYGDPSTARRLLNWHAYVNLEAGLRKLIYEYRQELLMDTMHGSVSAYNNRLVT